MNITNIKLRQKDHGFTIVELLVVIVVIAILAAITIVSYAGITARANTSASQAAANAFLQKAEAYNADQGVYPPLAGTLTSAASTTIYALSGVTVATANIAAAPATNITINYLKCSTVSLTGIAVAFWNYSDQRVNYLYSGAVSGGTLISIASTSPTCTVQPS